MNAILISGPDKKIYEVEMKASHWAMEEEIGTRFWAVRRLGADFSGDVLFHAEGCNVGYETYFCGGRGYSGSGLVCHVDDYGDLSSARIGIAHVAELTFFPDAPHTAWPWPKGT